MYFLMTAGHGLPHTDVLFHTVSPNSILNIIVQLGYLLKHIELQRETHMFI